MATLIGNLHMRLALMMSSRLYSSSRTLLKTMGFCCLVGFLGTIVSTCSFYLPIQPNSLCGRIMLHHFSPLMVVWWSISPFVTFGASTFPTSLLPSPCLTSAGHASRTTQVFWGPQTGLRKKNLRYTANYNL